MNSFSYTRPIDLREATREIAKAEDGALVAGGTNLIDLMKENVARPTRLIDINGLDLSKIEARDGGGLRLGALATNTDVAYHPEVIRRYPLLSKAILSGASAQLRNMATTGGNLLQRTRCYYFYDTAFSCNKREPGSGCPAIGGYNRIHAIFGASEHCIATHPSDMCVALSALEAVVEVASEEGRRSIPFEELHRLPGDTPHIDTTLRRGEIITSVDLPAKGFAANNAYLKARDRHSYSFALISVAAALAMDGDTITEARLSLGGVAHKPWRDKDAEAILVGERPGIAVFGRAAAEVMSKAKGFEHNTFKIELARRSIIRALREAAQPEAAR